jgi:protein-disulfide isomerase
VTVDELLQRHVYSQIKKDPTDEQLQVFYEAMDSKEPFDAVRNSMISKLRELRISKARSAYIASLHESAKISVTLPEPRAPLTLTASTPVRGPRNAPVMVVEFADYQCPYCRQLEPQHEQLRREFGDKIAVAFKDFPIPAHAYAEKMAEVARCAGEQGKYWELHDFMYKELKTFDMSQIEQRTQALNLDSAHFNQCVDSAAETAEITADKTEGQHLGVSGTPTVFINGRFISGNAKYEVLRDMVQQELAAITPHPRETAQR